MVRRVPREVAAFAAVMLAGVAVVVTHAGCRQPAVAPAPARAREGTQQQTKVALSDRAAERVQPEAKVESADKTRLPEDPVAGKRSEQQWREHMVDEERERQQIFDRGRLKEHRAVIKLIAAARAAYDRARTEAAVTKLRADMPRQIAEIRRRVTEIDHWGVNSRLLPDYDALTASLTNAYPDARIAALKGDARALDEVRTGFDQRMKKMADWLKEAAEGEHE